ncbi:MAG: rhomboid family intramembrane serine protease [Nitrospiraceae bacterium]|nr:rhomboid family intramembrane serine protease [Nitrospiraceae bacterium]
MIPFKDDNPSRTVPFVTFVNIAVNIAVFLLEILSPRDSQDIVYAYGAIPRNIITFTSDQPLPAVMTVFTSMFMHGGIMHLGGNMLYFWIFGNNIEDELGHLKFIFFYLFCGVVAAYSHALTSPGSLVPMIGASGAISGVLGAYLILFPSARVHTIVFFGFFIQVIRVPALIVIGFWAIIQLVSGLVSQGVLHQGGTAWFAHVGGFLAGLLTIKLWLPRRNSRWS